MPQNWNNLTTFTSYRWNQITREVKFPLQISGGLDHILLRKYYPTIIMWYAKLAPMKRKFWTEWGCVNSNRLNPYQIYQSHHANLQPYPEVIIKHDDLYARAWECEYDKPIIDSDRDNMVISNPPEVTFRPEEAANEIRSTPGTIPYRTTPQRFSPTQMKQMTERIRITTCSLMRIIVWSKLTRGLPTPAAQNMIYAITQGQCAMTTTDIKS